MPTGLENLSSNFISLQQLPRSAPRRLTEPDLKFERALQNASPKSATPPADSSATSPKSPAKLKQDGKSGSNKNDPAKADSSQPADHANQTDQAPDVNQTDESANPVPHDDEAPNGDASRKPGEKPARKLLDGEVKPDAQSSAIAAQLALPDQVVSTAQNAASESAQAEAQANVPVPTPRADPRATPLAPKAITTASSAQSPNADAIQTSTTTKTDSAPAASLNTATSVTSTSNSTSPQRSPADSTKPAATPVVLSLGGAPLQEFQPAQSRLANTQTATDSAAQSLAQLSDVASAAGDAMHDGPRPIDPLRPAPSAGDAAVPAALVNIAGSTAPSSGTVHAAALVPSLPPVASPDSDFASANHAQIVTSMRTQLLPNGGAMHIRLDPPELGVLQVTVRMVDGAMSASFETSSDQATRLLSHSLGQLKQVLESQGVSVEKLHVQQSPRDQQAGSHSDDQQHHGTADDQASARQEQQRREMLRRMWRRLGIGHDPLDLVA